MPAPSEKKVSKPQKEEVTEVLFNGEQWGAGKKILYRNLGDFRNDSTWSCLTAEQSPRTAPTLEFQLSALTFLHCSGILRKTPVTHSRDHAGLQALLQHK